MTDDGHQPPDLGGWSDDEFNFFVRSLSLVGVDTLSIHGEQLESGASPRTAYALETSFAFDRDGRLFLRFRVTAELHGEDDEKIVARVVGEVAVVYEFEGPAPTQGAVETFAGSSATMMATPFLRELIHSTASRLGHTGVFMPVMTMLPGALEATSSAEDAEPLPQD